MECTIPFLVYASEFSQITLFLASFWSTFPREAVRSELEGLVINAMIIAIFNLDRF